MDALLQLAQLFFVQPALAVLHLRARRSLVTLESLVQIRQIQLQQEGQLALAQARAARESAEIDARVNAQLGALGISPGPRASSGVVAPAASPLRGFGDLLAALLVYRGDPPAGPRLAQAAESILLQRIAPAEARRLATEEGHPLARPAALAQVAASLFGAAPAQDAWPAAALALPRARIGAVLAAAGAPSVAVEPGEQDVMRPVYFPVHGAFTLESPWPWIGQDVDAGGLVVSRLQHTGARFTGGTVLGDLQSLFGVTTEGPATLNATVLSGGPYDPVSLNRALDAWLSQLSLGLVPSRGAPSAREIEIAGVRAVALEYRFTRMLMAAYERRYLVPVPGGPHGIVLWWESPAAEAPRWSAEIDAAAHSLHLGPKPPSRMRSSTDATTGVPGVDRALRGAWLYDIGQGDLVEARAAADRALAEQPTSRRARFASAVVSAVSGDLAGALSRLEELWPAVDAGQARLVACFGLRTETWHHGLRPDGSAPGGGPLRPETPPWAARFEELIGSSPMDLPETFLVRVGVTAAGRTAADAATEAQMEKAGLSTPALLAGLREAAAVARRANLTQPFFYLATVADRIQASAGDAGGALAQLAKLAGDAEQTGDHTMCA